MNDFKSTAKPLVTVDPYFSIWSFSEELNADVTRHWTGRRNAMTLNIRIDGEWYSLMGKVLTDDARYFGHMLRMPQVSYRIEATKTEYLFENKTARITLSFRTPLLMDDLMLMSRPISYISYDIEYKDGSAHETEVYFDICSEICSDSSSAEVVFGKTGCSVFCGRCEQQELESSGDNRLIDWGYLHLVMPGSEYFVYDDADKNEIFRWSNDIKGSFEPRSIRDGFPALAAVKRYGAAESVNDFIIVGYDDVHSIEYFGEKLIPYWKKDGAVFCDAAAKAIADYDEINLRCDEFDRKQREVTENISKDYADIAALVYRHTIAAHKLAEHNGKPLYFSKECASNGCMATVDVTYPSIPLFILYNHELVKGMIDPIFEYAENDHGWNYEFAPHDIGIYPKASGQRYVSDRSDADSVMSENMPVEECGNMLLIVAAICKAEGSGEYARPHYATLKQWADYLVGIGYDPDNQLCTDDFAGALAHNCNLSLKLIIAVAAFGYISELLGVSGAEYRNTAAEYARQWEKMAFDGDCYRLAFNKPGSWSLKYNLVMDRYFGFGLFDASVAETEVRFYKTKANAYGIPLDCREDYTKSDWQMWTACLTDDREYFDLVVGRMKKVITKLVSRVPFTDWYRTTRPWHMSFQARSVQGGLFMPMLMKNMTENRVSSQAHISAQEEE